MPTPQKNESQKQYLERCVPKLIKEGKTPDQSIAICSSMWSSAAEESEIAEEVDGDFEDGDDDFSSVFAAENTKRLNKPFRTPSGPKKFSVYTKNDKGNIVKVNFGDPDMEIKRDDPERRKSFRARHNCDNPGPKWKARYWSCKFWSSPSVTNLLSKADDMTQDQDIEVCHESSIEFSANISDTGFTNLIQDEEFVIADATFSKVFSVLSLDPTKRYKFEICAEEE